MSFSRQEAVAEFNRQAYKRNNVTYLTRFDCATVYRAGKTGKPNEAFDNLRYLEDSRAPENWNKKLEMYITKTNEIITYVEKGQLYVLKRSGGVSLFDGPNPSRRMNKNNCWHIIVNGSEGTKDLDSDLIIEKKMKKNEHGLYHYSIQPNRDMLVKDFISKLRDFASNIKEV